MRSLIACGHYDENDKTKSHGFSVAFRMCKTAKKILSFCLFYQLFFTNDYDIKNTDILLHISRRAARSKLKKAQSEYLVVGHNQVKIKKSPLRILLNAPTYAGAFFMTAKGVL